MTSILVINSSSSGAASVSSSLTAAFVAEVRAADPAAKVAVRELGVDPVPHLTADRLAGVRGTPRTEAEIAAARLADTLVAELQAADTLVIGSPMYNFGISSPLKSWFDHVLRAGVTFRYTANGPQGLLVGKRALVAESRGGLYSSGPGAANDHQEAHLRTLLGFMGITDVSWVRAEQLSIGPAEREAAVESALAEIRALAPAFAMAAA